MEQLVMQFRSLVLLLHQTYVFPAEQSHEPAALQHATDG